MVTNLVGPPVQGENFVGRKHETEIAISSIANGNSLLLAAPRRVGKSSFAHHIIDKMKDKGWDGLFIDLQGIGSISELSDLLIRQFTSIQHKDAFKLGIENFLNKGLRRISKIDVKGVEVELGDINESLALAERHMAVKNKCVVVLDEVAVFMEEISRKAGINGAKNILDWLRKTRVSNACQISWIYCSSVSLRNFCSEHNLSHTINDLQTFDLGEFSQEEAFQLLSQLDINTRYFSPTDISSILCRIGWKLPFFIQLFYSKYQMMRHDISEKSMTEATETVLNALEREQALDSWSERLSGYGKNEQIARTILDYTCQPGAKASREKLVAVISSKCHIEDNPDFQFSQVRQMLETDGYIMSTNDGTTVFRSPVIRDYWFKKYIR